MDFTFSDPHTDHVMKEHDCVLCLLVVRLQLQGGLVFQVCACVLLCFNHINAYIFAGGKRGDYLNCSVLYCVLKLHTVISTLRSAVLTVLWIGFCHTGPIALCVDLFVFVRICVFFVSYCIVVVSL